MAAFMLKATTTMKAGLSTPKFMRICRGEGGGGGHFQCVMHSCLFSMFRHEYEMLFLENKTLTSMTSPGRMVGTSTRMRLFTSCDHRHGISTSFSPHTCTMDCTGPAALSVCV